MLICSSVFLMKIFFLPFSVYWSILPIFRMVFIILRSMVLTTKLHGVVLFSEFQSP